MNYVKELPIDFNDNNTFIPEELDGVIGMEEGHGGNWCPGCKERGEYHWLDNPKLGCYKCGTNLDCILDVVDYSKGTMTYKEECRIRSTYEYYKHLNLL